MLYVRRRNAFKAGIHRGKYDRDHIRENNKTTRAVRRLEQGMQLKTKNPGPVDPHLLPGEKSRRALGSPSLCTSGTTEKHPDTSTRPQPKVQCDIVLTRGVSPLHKRQLRGFVASASSAWPHRLLYSGSSMKPISNQKNLQAYAKGP